MQGGIPFGDTIASNPDTVSEVIRNHAKRPGKSRRRMIVDHTPATRKNIMSTVKPHERKALMWPLSFNSGSRFAPEDKIWCYELLLTLTAPIMDLPHKRCFVYSLFHGMPFPLREFSHGCQ